MTRIPTLREIEREFRHDVTQPSWRRKAPAAGPVTMTGATKDLFDHLMKIAREHESARAKKTSELKTKRDVLRRGRFARKIFREVQGLARFPSRTPLKAIVRPAFERERYRVEHIILQSRPGYYVAGNLYRPTCCPGPWPAVLCVSGHTLDGKHGYQRTAVELASCGLAAFSVEPAGQGERDEYVDVATGRRTIPRACAQHSAAGDPAYLLGANFGGYRLWDCIRAIDYLSCRRDVVASRIGVTGISGGGWESLWLAAIDTRVQAVASHCYLTTWRRRMENRCADAEGDPEQDPFGVVSSGLDASDLLVACCPRPVALGMTKRDFFPIDGALASFAEAKKLYRLAGAGGRIASIVEDAGHELTRGMRKLTCEWMLRWLKSARNPDAAEIVDRPWQNEPESLTNCTATGIVLTSLGGKTTAQLNAERARELAIRRKVAIGRLSGLLRFKPVRGPVIVKWGMPKATRGLTVTPLRIRSEGKLRLSAHLWRKPSEGPQPAMIFVAEKDERYDPFKNAACRELATAGTVVLDLDPRGMGPRREIWDRFVPLVEADLAYDAFLLGRTLAGMRVADIVRGLDVLLRTPGVDGERIGVTGEGYGALLALFAGVIEPRFARVVERHGLSSWSSLVWHREYAWGVNAIVPGALRHFDLTDLRASLGPRSVVLDPLDHLRRPG